MTRRRRWLRHLAHGPRVFQLLDGLRSLERLETGDVGLNDDVVDAVGQQDRRRNGSRRRLESLLLPLGLVLDVLDVGAAQGQRPSVAVDREAVLLDGLLQDSAKKLLKYFLIAGPSFLGGSTGQ